MISFTQLLLLQSGPVSSCTRPPKCVIDTCQWPHIGVSLWIQIFSEKVLAKSILMKRILGRYFGSILEASKVRCGVLNPQGVILVAPLTMHLYIIIWRIQVQ